MIMRETGEALILGTKVQRFKKHLRDNKKTYIVGVVGTTAGAVVGGAFMSRVYGIQIVDSLKFQLLCRTTNAVEMTIAVAPRGHRGFPVYDKITEKGYGSLKHAADILGTTRNAIIDNRVPGHDFIIFDENLTGNITVPA